MAFAVDGAKKASQRASLLSALDDHIGSKDRLTSPLVVKEVRNLLQEIASLDSPGNKILQRAAFVKRLLELANRPVWITLQSDGQTEVVIFRVGIRTPYACLNSSRKRAQICAQKKVDPRAAYAVP